MIAKEKAKELVERMQAQRYMSLGAAAQCALICVDELIKECTAYRPSPESRFDYWKEVKEEIRKL